MKPIVAFEQIRQIMNTVEDLWITRDFYRSKLISFIPADQLDQELKIALANPDARQVARARFEEARNNLDSLAQLYAIEELSQTNPPTDQSN